MQRGTLSYAKVRATRIATNDNEFSHQGCDALTLLVTRRTWHGTSMGSTQGHERRSLRYYWTTTARS